jgi:hypothetical protein
MMEVKPFSLFASFSCDISQSLAEYQQKLHPHLRMGGVLVCMGLIIAEDAGS